MIIYPCFIVFITGFLALVPKKKHGKSSFVRKKWKIQTEVTIFCQLDFCSVNWDFIYISFIIESNIISFDLGSI